MVCLAALFLAQKFPFCFLLWLTWRLFSRNGTCFETSSLPHFSLSRLMLHLSHLPIPPLLRGPHPTSRMGGYQSLWLIFRIRIASGEDGFNRGEQRISKKRGLALSPLKQEARFSICTACWFNTLQSWAAWPTHILHSTRTTARQWQPLKRVKQGAKYYVCGFSCAWKWRKRA